MKKWYYYLHTNGDLIGKPPIVVDSDPEYFNSPFVDKVWCIDLDDRLSVWDFIIEACNLGANKDRIKELSEKWKLTSDDLPEYLLRVKEPSELQKAGVGWFIKHILELDPNTYFEMLQIRKE